MVATGIALLIWRSGRRERQAALVPGALALAGFLLSAIAGHSTLLGRNLLPIWLPAAIFLAAGLGAARMRFVGIVASVVLCAIGITAVVSVDTTFAFQRPKWQLVANELGTWPRHGQSSRNGRIIVVQDNPSLLPLGLYLKDLRYIKQPKLDGIVEVDVVAALPHKGLSGFCWWGSECNLVPSHLDRRYVIPGFRVVARRRVCDFGIIEMRAPKPTTVLRTELPAAGGREQRHFIPSGPGQHDAQLVERT